MSSQQEEERSSADQEQSLLSTMEEGQQDASSSSISSRQSSNQHIGTTTTATTATTTITTSSLLTTPDQETPEELKQKQQEGKPSSLHAGSSATSTLTTSTTSQSEVVVRPTTPTSPPALMDAKACPPVPPIRKRSEPILVPPPHLVKHTNGTHRPPKKCQKNNNHQSPVIPERKRSDDALFGEQATAPIHKTIHQSPTMPRRKPSNDAILDVTTSSGRFTKPQGSCPRASRRRERASTNNSTTTEPELTTINSAADEEQPTPPTLENQNGGQDHQVTTQGEVVPPVDRFMMMKRETRDRLDQERTQEQQEREQRSSEPPHRGRSTSADGVERVLDGAETHPASAVVSDGDDPQQSSEVGGGRILPNQDSVRRRRSDFRISTPKPNNPRHPLQSDTSSNEPGAVAVGSQPPGSAPYRPLDSRRPSRDNSQSPTHNGQSNLAPLVPTEYQPRTSAVANAPPDADENPSNKKTEKKKRWPVLWLVLVIVASVGVGIGLALSNGRSKPGGPQPTPTVTSAAAASPTQSPVVEVIFCAAYPDFDMQIDNFNDEEQTEFDDMQKMVTKLFDGNFSLPSRLDEYCTPLHVAIIWMVRYSGHRDTGLAAAELEQRFMTSYLYFATNGNKWRGDTANWLSQKDVCDWAGVICRNSAITELNLSNQFEEDTRGEDDFLLKAVTLPPEVVHFRSLRVLRLDSNYLSGTLPNTLTALRDLEILDIQRNRRLAGTIPENLFGNLTQLKIFLAAECGLLELTMPSTMGRLSNLEEMSVFGTGATGTIPSEIGMLTSLVRFDAGDSRVDGPIPSEFGNLTNLAFLLLGRTGIKGTLPSELGLLTNIDFRNTLLVGTVPASYERLAKLKHFQVGNTQLSGDVLLQRSSFPELECFAAEGSFLDITLIGTSCETFHVVEEMTPGGPRCPTSWQTCNTCCDTCNDTDVINFYECLV